MTPLLAKAVWVLGVVGWFVIRYPHDRRARRTPTRDRCAGVSACAARGGRGRESLLMAISAAGLGVLPLIYVISNVPRFADYAFRPWQGWIGAAVFAGSLWLFRRTHKDL